ncbi:MAG: prepilin-type N-terminal cleavage/methylation domain-containing protein [Fimbriimonadales bacterium]
MKISRAFTLTEMLVVILIVALLAALLFPVLVGAKNKSKEVPCMSNLRQLYVAWSLYTQDDNDTMPPSIREVAHETPGGVKAVLTCPSDTYGGANKPVSASLGYPVSYYYILNQQGFRDALYAADPNHGIMYCVLHGVRKQPPVEGLDARLDTTGLVLRLRRDGSIQHAKVGHMCGPVTSQGRIEGRQPWNLLSDTHCIEPYCFGLTEPCGE